LELNEDDIDAGRDFTVGAVVDDAGDRAGGGRGGEGQKQTEADDGAV
jgi:hypothetical protein